jgi:galactarate dehydratase
MPLRDIEAGSWIRKRGAHAAGARADQPADRHHPARAAEPLEGYTFEGYRNADGSVGTRNILAITTTVQCVSGVVDFAVKRIKDELLPRYPERRRRGRPRAHLRLRRRHRCAGAEVPIRTLRNISKNPNFGGQAMVVSLGCEKLQPARLFPEGLDPDR